MAEYEIKALHAQMNPHFIFNCLNSIREMILNNEDPQASHYLSKFAHLIRITLNNSSKPFINLQNTIDYLQRYLEMELIRTTNFSYNIKTDEAIHPADIFLPPMLIQPFIENAIWHGTPSQKEPIEINIHFIHKDNHLLCIIEDNGIGIETSLKKKKEQGEIQGDHYSLGITNVKQRIGVLNEKYNLRSSVTIEDKNNLPGHTETGTLVTIYLPFKNTEL
jgi:LytS/YehU family sensor histidine kinase